MPLCLCKLVVVFWCPSSQSHGKKWKKNKPWLKKNRKGKTQEPVKSLFQAVEVCNLGEKQEE